MSAQVTRVATYIRCNRAEEDVRSALNAQAEECMSAVGGEELIVTREYVDIGSGLDELPAMISLLSDAECSPRPFDAVLVRDWSRFARSPARSRSYRNRLLAAGVDLISARGRVNATEPSPELLASLCDEWYSVGLSANIAGALKARRDRESGDGVDD